MPTDEHPSFMLEKISKLNNNQFGHNLFGLGETIKRNPKDYLSAINEMYFSEARLFFMNKYKKVNFNKEFNGEI